MFDIEIVVPVSGEGKYGTRLKEFKEYGLLNVGTRKVLLKLLAGNEKIIGLESGWPEGVTARTVKSRHEYVTSKIYDYYGHMTLSEVEESRWFAKFDDDSITDVSSLMDNLELEFDHERDYYVVTELCKDKHRPEIDLLRKMGYERWINEKAKPILHEWEGNVVSQSAMKRIVENSIAMEFMRKRSDITNGPGDKALAVAARLCKIYPTDASFMTKHPLVHRLTCFGGDLSHIHFVSYDKNMKQFQMLKRMVNLSKQPPNEIHDKLCNRDYMYCRDGKLAIALVRLNPNGTFSNIDNDNERFWEVDGVELRFLTSDCVVSSVFTLTDDFSQIHGRYMFEDGVQHSLRALA